jgi:hypothetical protein
VLELGATVPNPFPNPVFSGATMPKDPGAQISYTAGARWQSDSAWDAVYVVENGINNGIWGYNNLQWTGFTWYHRFSPDWHLAWETYLTEQKNVLNITDPLGIIANGGYPFSPANGSRFNGPFFAQCDNPEVLTCTAMAFGSMMYLNHRLSPLDNLTFRSEFFDDMQVRGPARKPVMSIAGLAGSTGFRRRSKFARRWIIIVRSMPRPSMAISTRSLSSCPTNEMLCSLLRT